MGDDGLKYVFEIDGQSPGMEKLNAALETTEKLLPKVEHASKSAAHGHGEHAKGAEHLGGVLEKVTHQALHPFLEKAEQIAKFEFIRQGADALLEFPLEMIEHLKELGEEMINVAAKTERTNTSFGLLFGKKEGNELLEYIESVANATEFTDDRLKSAAQSLGKVGFEGEKLTRALAASLDISAFSPDKEAGFGEALASLERIKRTGHVDNRVLGGLGIGQEDFFKELSARTGEGVATLKKKIEAGKVDSEQALESLYTMIARKTGQDLGGAGVTVGKGLEAKLTHLKDLPEQFFQKMAKTEAFDKLTAAADRLLEKLSPESKTGQKLFETLERGASAVVDVIDSIDVDKIGDALEELADDVKPLISLFSGLANAVFKVASGVDAVANSKLGHIVGTVVSGTGTVLKGAGKAFLDAHGVSPLIDYLTSKSEPKRPAEKTGAAAGEGLAAGMKASAPKVDRAGEQLGDAASGATRKALDIHSPSKVFAELGAQTAAGFAAGIESGEGMVDDVTRGAFAAPAPQGGRVAAIGGSPVVVSFGDIVVNVPGGTSSTADEIADRAADRLREEVIEMFEDMRLEAGT